MPRGESLLDELKQAEHEAAHDDGSSSDAAHPSRNRALLAAAPTPTPADVPVPSVAPAHTPLAKYLSRINSSEQGVEPAEADTAEADTRETRETQEAADDHIEDEGPTQTDDASAQSGSPSRASLLASLALEMLAPAVCSCLLPAHTLAARSKQWCIQTLLISASTTTNNQGVGLKPSSVLRKQQRALYAQIASQLSRIRGLYLGSIVLATLQSSFFGLQLLWLALHQLGLHVILPLLLLGSPAPPSSPPADAGSSLWPFVCLLLLLLALFNIVAALGNLRSSTAWHSLLVSADACVSTAPAAAISAAGLSARFEAQSKALILQLMERELVKRGYQLSGSSSNLKSNSQRSAQPQGFVPIERMDSVTMRLQPPQQLEDGSTRIRRALRDMFQQQARQLFGMRRQIQQMSVELDAFAPSPESHVDPAAAEAAAFLAHAEAASLPSIVQLKSMRSEWIHARSMLEAAFLALLARLRLPSTTGPQSALAAPFPLQRDQSIEEQLSRAFLQLRIALSGHVVTMDSLLPPSCPPSAPSAAAAAGLDAELPASRRALQQSLCDVHNSIRSADRRLQIALERQQQACMEAARPIEEASAASGQAAAKPQGGMFDRIRSELFPVQLLSDSKEDVLPAVSSAAPATAAAAAAPWSAPLSSSFSQDVSYLRTLIVQLTRHCDTLEIAVKNADGDAGLDLEALARGAQKPAPSAETLLSHSDDDASSSSSASTADASLSQSDLFAALLSMRQKKAQTPAGMGAVFEGSGAFTEPPLRPRPRPTAAAPTAAAPAVSIFTILSELKSVLHNRPQAFEYVVHNRDVPEAPAPAKKD